MVYTTSTLGADKDGEADCGATVSGPDVWYRYIAATDGQISLISQGQGYDMMLSFHSACPGAPANQLACARIKIEDFPVVAGQEIYIRVSGFDGQSGVSLLQLTGPPLWSFDSNNNGILDACEFDFGDAPDTGAATGPGNYATLLADNGPRHRRTGPVLGRAADVEPDAHASSDARGDDDAGGADEDGVTFLTPLSIGNRVELRVHVSRQSGVLDGWIDFNRNGDFNDPGEQISTSTSVQLGTNPLLISIPTNALAGSVFARFRLSTAGGLSPLGAAADGEVEDYRINLEAAPANFEIQPLLSGRGLTLVTTPGFAYTLQYVTNTSAKFWGWSDVTNFVDIPGSGALQTFTDTNALDIGIYRLKRVQLP